MADYGKGAGITSVAGVAVLPFTGSNTVLLYAAAGLVAAGLVVLIASAIVARRNRAIEAK